MQKSREKKDKNEILRQRGSIKREGSYQGGRHVSTD